MLLLQVSYHNLKCKYPTTIMVVTFITNTQLNQEGVPTSTYHYGCAITGCKAKFADAAQAITHKERHMKSLLLHRAAKDVANQKLDSCLKNPSHAPSDDDKSDEDYEEDHGRAPKRRKTHWCSCCRQKKFGSYYLLREHEMKCFHDVAVYGVDSSDSDGDDSLSSRSPTPLRVSCRGNPIPPHQSCCWEFPCYCSDGPDAIVSDDDDDDEVIFVGVIEPEVVCVGVVKEEDRWRELPLIDLTSED